MKLKLKPGIREVTRRQFDAYCYVRNPYLRTFSNEVAWFEAFDKKILGVVVIELYDKDFGFVILGRDARSIFQAIKLPEQFYNDMADAVQALIETFEEFRNDDQLNYPQGDEKSLPHEIFRLQITDERKVHPYFKLLLTEPRFEAARNLIQEIAYSYLDVDGNYIKDFQSTGFDARLWELYLYVYLHTAGFSIDKSFQAPDYCLNYFSVELSIEAVTVNASELFDEKGPTNAMEAHLLRLDYMPIKFGSPLTSKLKKRYWEKEHVKGKPLIFAIHDYHQPANRDTPGSMTWSRFALMDYLYGVRPKTREEADKFVAEYTTDEVGVEAVLEKIKTHNWKGKSIPSNYFGLPDAENVSAVLFSNNGTITTFNRMGKLAGLGSHAYKMIRFGYKFDPEPFATEPQIFAINIDAPEYEEAWSDGLVMYHNPYAKFPVDPNCFSDISHVWYDPDKNILREYIQPGNVFSSLTTVFSPGQKVPDTSIFLK